MFNNNEVVNSNGSPGTCIANFIFSLMDDFSGVLLLPFPDTRFFSSVGGSIHSGSEFQFMALVLLAELASFRLQQQKSLSLFSFSALLLFFDSGMMQAYTTAKAYSERTIISKVVVGCSE
mmetsp:Transcript_5686/g.13300  ORF Transcript_5686/g.13300 Transcript_5686/m.13300 type:complete len:120 (+) Transcript_5686:913-1272(+)